MGLQDILFKLIKRARDRNVPDFHIWNVLTGLRGHDSDDSITLKRLTTGRIRGILFDNDDVSHVFGKPSPLTDEEIILRNGLLMKAGRHFRSHFAMATRGLTVLGYDIPEKERYFSR